MISKAQIEAEHFLKDEKQFHLGMLPTEQSNLKTRNLDKIFASSVKKGVETLLSVDRDVQTMAVEVLRGEEFKLLVKIGVEAILSGKKIVFSGCGATGRLSILLESMWRRFFRKMETGNPEIFRQVGKFENNVFSIMTGGDYALIRSVEYFEDYMEFGRQQVREMNMEEGDILVAITEGGETSSVLGTVDEAANRGAKVFLLFNNPAEILKKHIDRSKKAIEDPRVTVLGLYCCPMAIAGSTRMQATTSEQLIAGAALEMILNHCLKKFLSPKQLKALNVNEVDYAGAFEKLLDDLVKEKNTKILADYLRKEQYVYQKNGLITYFADEFLLDIFTDTTERAPTFMLPPFKKFDDNISQPSWAFVKNPLHKTSQSWERTLARKPRCLDWDTPLYKQMGVPDKLALNPPTLNISQIMRFHIGNELDVSRTSTSLNIAVKVLGSREKNVSNYTGFDKKFEQCTKGFQEKVTLIIGECKHPADFCIGYTTESSVLNLMEHMAVKLILNTISTGTMVLMGRVTSNWMSWVEVSNKKLRDRGIRLISELGGISYEEACYALHETLEELNSMDMAGKEKPSPIQYTLKKVKERYGK